ncbi:hypothetical protein [Tamlana flava]|uniref:hypothetical protein n=1 Tax=Tamlana flava TaxID=3158572 RepID=UPI00351AC710
MKNLKYLIIITLIPLMGFAQFFSKEKLTNNEDFEVKAQELEPFNDSIKRTKVHWDLAIGTFIPTKNANLIGVKPTFGGSVGLIHKQMTYDLTFDVRFTNTKMEYQLADGTMTNHYLGGYVGIDILRDIWTHNKNQILLLGGIGLDMFEIVPGEYRDPTFLETLLFGDDRVTIEESTNIFSSNINIGLMYRFYYNRKNYFGIRYKYNIVNYNSRKILTDVTGNFHSITLSFGGGILD